RRDARPRARAAPRALARPAVGEPPRGEGRQARPGRAGQRARSDVARARADRAHVARAVDGGPGQAAEGEPGEVPEGLCRPPRVGRAREEIAAPDAAQGELLQGCRFDLRGGARAGITQPTSAADMAGAMAANGWIAGRCAKTRPPSVASTRPMRTKCDGAATGCRRAR